MALLNLLTTALLSAVTTPTSQGCRLTAYEGDADNREKDRDSENQHTIHRVILHFIF